jgi:hypothetical protein
MGISQSDLREQQAHEVIDDIPMIGGVYDGIRAAVYTGMLPPTSWMTQSVLAWIRETLNEPIC